MAPYILTNNEELYLYNNDVTSTPHNNGMYYVQRNVDTQTEWVLNYKNIRQMKAEKNSL